MLITRLAWNSAPLEFPKLSAVTAGLDASLVKLVGNNLGYYSTAVQQDYENYVTYMKEYETWSDSISTPNFLQDY